MNIQISSSLIAAILESSPHMNRSDALRRLVREYMEAPSEFTGGMANDYGRMHRDGAIVEYEMETGNTVGRTDPVLNGWAEATIAGFIDEDGAILEVYCPFNLRNKQFPVPFKKLEQMPHMVDRVQFDLWVTGRKTAHFWQWAPQGTRLDVVHASHQWREYSIPIIKAFSRTFADAIKDPAKHLSPKVPDMVTDEVMKLLDEHDQLSDAIYHADQRRREILDDLARLSKGGKRTLDGRRIVSKVDTNYAKALAYHAPQADLEPFRGDAKRWHLEGWSE